MNLMQNRFSSAHALGLRVFPVLAKDKKPAVSWTSYRDHPPSEEELAAWDASEFNVGVMTGSASGVIVLDVDSAEAQAVVDQLDLPATPTVRTGKGTHYYFRSPTVEVRNRTHIGGVNLDVRGEGGFVVGAGSVHPSGATYDWLLAPDEVPFAEMPPQLLQHLQPAKSLPAASAPPACSEQQGRVRGPFDSILNRSLGEAVEEIRSAEEGNRNNTLFRAAARVARDVAGAGAAWDALSDRLLETALAKGLEPSEVTATLASAWAAGSAEPTPWMVTARGWVYLAKADVFYHLNSREHIKVSAFNNSFAAQRPNKKVAFSAFLLNGGHVRIVHDLDYQPGKPDLYFEREGVTWLNTYRPSTVVAQEGDWGPFVDFISYLVPEPDEREHLLKMIAWTVRYPGKKLSHALLMRSERQGVGKTMLTDIWSELLGSHNVRKTTTEEVQGAYQGYIKQTLLVLLEELNWGVGPVGYNRLKELITGTTASVNEKFIPVRQWPNLATFVILTNLKAPLMIEDHDRRIFYIDTPAEPQTKEYYAQFVAWWQPNLGVIRAFLDTVDLSTFQPFAPAPMTAAKQKLIADSRTVLAKDLALLIEERAGPFDRDVVTLVEVEEAMGPFMRGRSKSELRDTLKSIGAISFGQQRVPVGLSGLGVTRDRASLWAIRNMSYWSHAGAAARGQEFRRLEGIFAQYDALHIAVRHVSEWPGPRSGLIGQSFGTGMDPIDALELMAGYGG